MVVVGTWGVFILTPTLLDVDANLGLWKRCGPCSWLCQVSCSSNMSQFSLPQTNTVLTVLEVSGGVRDVCDELPLAHCDSSGWRTDSVSLWGGCMLGRKIWTWCSQHLSSCLFGWTSYSICLWSKPAGNLRILLEYVWERLLSIHRCSLLLSVSVSWFYVLLLLSGRSLST